MAAAVFLLIPPAAVLTALLATWRGIVRAGRAADPPRADAIVVFGARAQPDGPSRELAARLRHAAELFRSGSAPRIICSGGHPGPNSEPRVMATALERLGIPSAAIAIDEQGESTRATLAALVAAGTPGHVLLVSSPYHMHRIGREAQRLGLRATLCPSPPTPVMRGRASHAKQMLREIVASWWYALTAHRPEGRQSIA